MITAYHSTVLDHPVDRVWSLIRDFNNYAAYMDGVSASVIEDNKRGDEVGAVRRFKYGDNWIRQRLSEHSDTQRTPLVQNGRHWFGGAGRHTHDAKARAGEARGGQ